MWRRDPAKSRKASRVSGMHPDREGVQHIPYPGPRIRCFASGKLQGRPRSYNQRTQASGLHGVDDPLNRPGFVYEDDVDGIAHAEGVHLAAWHDEQAASFFDKVGAQKPAPPRARRLGYRRPLRQNRASGDVYYSYFPHM